MPFAMSRITGCSDLTQLAFAANDFVKRCYELFDAGKPGQTTLVAARVRRLAIAEYMSIGDSRAYMLTPQGFLKRRYRCKQITTDQTHGERKKRVTYKEPDKFRNDMMIHAIGAGLIAEEIETGTVSIPPGGMLLLATDGFFNGMGEDHCSQIARLADKYCGMGMQKLAAALVSEAAENFDTGDDITVAVISPAYLAGARWPFWGAAMAALLTCILTVF
jgi:serine/threonine protein phosphatase PrpC